MLIPNLYPTLVEGYARAAEWGVQSYQMTEDQGVADYLVNVVLIMFFLFGFVRLMRQFSTLGLIGKQDDKSS